jgi:hypothetical protein
MIVCEQCRELRTTVKDLRTGRYLCGLCLVEFEPTALAETDLDLYEQFLRNSRDGIMCLRCVQIESDRRFELLFVETTSNVDALKLAAAIRPGVTNMWARPVED